jgi:peptidoglycan/LPS O-acetylase OafA/YrhL
VEQPGAAPTSSSFVAGDPLRAIAALSVLVFHQVPAPLTYGNPAFVAAFGAIPALLLAHLDLGLYLFFVLSGYLLSRQFLRAYILGTKQPSIRRFFQNRALRIVPAYWAIFTIFWLRHMLLPDGFPAGTFASPPYQLAAIYGFFQNFFPVSRAAFVVGLAWTLDVEVAFYCLIPLAFLAIVNLGWRPASARGRTWLVIAMLALVAAASFAFRVVTPHDLLWERSIPAMLIGFVPGVFLATLEPTLESRLAGLSRGHLLAYALLPVSLVALVGYHLVSGYLPASDAGSPPLRTLLAAVGTGCLVASPLVWQWSGRPAWSVLDNRALHWAGKRSYGIYLLHWCIGLELVFFGTGLSPRVRTVTLLAIVLPATLVAAAASYRFIEKPFLDLKSRVPGSAPSRRVRRGLAMGLGGGLAFAAVMAVAASPAFSPRIAPSTGTASLAGAQGQAGAIQPSASPVAGASGAPLPGATPGQVQTQTQPTPAVAGGVPLCAANDLALTLTQPGTAVVPGTATTIGAVIRNVSARTCSIESVPGVLVTDHLGNVVYQHCTSSAPCAEGSRTIPAGESLSSSVQWDGQSAHCVAGNCQNAPVPPGTYTAAVEWDQTARTMLNVAAAPPVSHGAPISP